MMKNTAELLERIQSWSRPEGLNEEVLRDVLWALAMDRDLHRAFTARVDAVRDDYHNEMDRNTDE